MSNQKISAEEENATFNIIQEIEKYLRNWKWFFLSVSIATILAFIYLRYATPVL
jgi:flagellar biogenesis protein FliO